MYDRRPEGVEKDGCLQQTGRNFTRTDLLTLPTVDSVSPQASWSPPLSLPAPLNPNQGCSDSWMCQAWSSYHWQLHNHAFSRRDLYSRLYLPQGGAYIRDGGAQIVSNGQAMRDEVNDP